MIPDIELQLQVVLKSLGDNVMPAVDPANELARQQMQLSLAMLKIIADHLPRAHATLRVDIENQRALALALCRLELAAADRMLLEQEAAAAAAALADPRLGISELQQRARQLREVIGDVIRASEQSAEAEEVEKMVLRHGESALNLGRAWNKPMGFELDPADVPELPA